MLARPLALVLVACAAFTDTTGAHGAAFLFALAAMPALLVATLVALADVADARGGRAKAAAVFQAMLSVAALGLLGITAASSSSALLRAFIPGTPVPALLACLGAFLVQWALAVSEIGRASGRVETGRDRVEAVPESSGGTRRRSQRRAA
ncbi:MAG: hypothetical protein ACXVZO_04920 [Gaiellaceae bacterium]